MPSNSVTENKGSGFSADESSVSFSHPRETLKDYLVEEINYKTFLEALEKKTLDFPSFEQRNKQKL